MYGVNEWHSLNGSEKSKVWLCACDTAALLDASVASGRAEAVPLHVEFGPMGLAQSRTQRQERRPTNESDGADRVVDSINEAQLAEFREAFAAFDKDRSGHIDAEELRHVLLAVGEDASEEEAAQMIDLADSDGTGTIDFWEFATLMAHKMRDPNPDRTLRAAFSCFDENGDGTISVKEIRKVMRNLGERVNEDDIASFVTKVDLDGNGSIDYSEFSKFVMSEVKSTLGGS